MVQRKQPQRAAAPTTPSLRARAAGERWLPPGHPSRTGPRQVFFGFSLVEVTLALGVAAFCLVALFGLLPVGLNSNQLAAQQFAADGFFSAVGADLLATRPPSPLEVSGGTAVSSQQFSIPIPVNPIAASPTATTLYFSAGGQCSKDLSGATKADGTPWPTPIQPVARLTVTFLPNGSNPKATTFVGLHVTWPATTAVAASPSSAQTFVALDRN